MKSFDELKVRKSLELEGIFGVQIQSLVKKMEHNNLSLEEDAELVSLRNFPNNERAQFLATKHYFENYEVRNAYYTLFDLLNPKKDEPIDWDNIEKIRAEIKKLESRKNKIMTKEEEAEFSAIKVFPDNLIAQDLLKKQDLGIKLSEEEKKNLQNFVIEQEQKKSQDAQGN